MAVKYLKARYLRKHFLEEGHVPKYVPIAQDVYL